MLFLFAREEPDFPLLMQKNRQTELFSDTKPKAAAVPSMELKLTKRLRCFCTVFLVYLCVSTITPLSIL